MIRSQFVKGKVQVFRWNGAIKKPTATAAAAARKTLWASSLFFSPAIQRVTHIEGGCQVCVCVLVGVLPLEL